MHLKTPSFAHSRILRQHVTPLTPKASLGSMFHCMSVLRTKRMSRMQSSSEARGRPPLSEGLDSGISCLMLCHSSSGKISAHHVLLLGSHMKLSR